MDSIPKVMRIIEAPTPGGPEALKIGEAPCPAPGAGEVLIRVAAIGINRADTQQRRGVYPSPPGAPAWPGLEVAGVVAAVGSGVAEFPVDTPVCALLAGGGYAEYCVAPIAQTLPIPGQLTLIEAASLPEAYFTVWSNVYGFGRLAPGETLLVHGGSSGIGVAAIQLTRALGHTVYATAGSVDKCHFCESMGATRGINYRDEDFVAVLQELTAGRGVDVILDMVGGDYLARDVQALASDGRIVVIATQAGTAATLDLRQIMVKRAHITGSMLRPRPVSFKDQIKAQLLSRVWPLLADGTLRPVVDRVFGFGEAPAAHAYMESGGHMGKLILKI
jgi:putative PIG3 family NAD(P)H quinone oxidoreductase